KSRSFIPLVIASTLATSVHVMLLGPGPMFTVGSLDFGIPRALPMYVVLGLICGLAAVGFSKVLYWTEDLFEKLPLDPMWWPAIGALGLGVIGYFVPRVLGVGYDTISDILNGSLPLKALLAVAFFKSLALVVSLGSGTSGGLLAPMFMASAAMGGAYAMGMNRAFPSLHAQPGAYALVAMGAVFGAASRAAFAFIIFAFEITRDYNAVLPLMLVTVIADGVALLLSRTSIMTEKLARRGLRIHTDYEADVLQQVTVGEVMSREAPCVPEGMTVAELSRRITERDPEVTAHHGLPVVDSNGLLCGIITRGDLLRALDSHPSGEVTVGEVGRKLVVVTYPDETLHEALHKMLERGVGRLPVMDRRAPGRVIGYLGRPQVLQARMRRLHEEHVREPGWMPRLARSQR